MLINNIIRSSIALSIAFAVLIATPLNAQSRTSTSTTSSSTPRVIIEPIKFNLEAFKKGVAERRLILIKNYKPAAGEQKIKLETSASKRVTTNLQKIFSSLAARVARVSSADTKISMRINEARLAGVNVATTTTLFIKAQETLGSTRVTLEAAKQEALAQATSTTSRDIIYSLVKTAEESVRAAATAYVNVIESLEKAYPSVKSAVIE